MDTHSNSMDSVKWICLPNTITGITGHSWNVLLYATYSCPKVTNFHIDVPSTSVFTPLCEIHKFYYGFLYDAGVGIAMSVQWLATGWCSSVGRVKNFLFSTSSRPALGSTQPPIQCVSGREADHSPTATAKVKKMWIYTSTSPYVFTAQCLIKDRDNFTLPLTLRCRQ
jgi:hypothetical protein